MSQRNEHWLEQKYKVKELLSSVKKVGTKWKLLMIGYDFN